MRWPRSLRAAVLLALISLFVLTGFACLILRWGGEREEDFQRRLARWGGRSQPILDNNHPLEPLRPYLGMGIYLSVAGSKGRLVEAGGSEASREQLAELLTVQPIRTVRAGGAKRLDDDWVAGIEAPGALEELILDETSVTDRSVDRFLEMKNLQFLGLVNTAVGDSAVDRLRLLPSLKRLYVGGPNLRVVQLLESRFVDGSGTPAVRAGVPLRVEGRISAEGLPSRLRYVLARHHLEGTAPVWTLSSQHTQSRAGELGNLEESSPGLWSFRVGLPPLPPGRWIVDLSVVPEDGERSMKVFYRLAELEVELMPPIPPGPAPVEPR